MKHRVLPTFGLAVVCLACAVPVLAQKLEGVPPKTGHATFTFASKDLTYDVVEGGFQQVEGFTTATLVFRPAVKPKANSHLNLTLMYQAPGKVDLAAPFSVNGIAMFGDGSVTRYTKGKSQCTITLTKATPTEVEGTADCPLLHDISGEVAAPLTNVKFSATTK
ncbi:MAG: hypothetical protein A3H96_26405 [Acidobacteria bacterium RIFCSPLOWO2_02_FULL_67_36]|nr:MAG: hypothetical protein A3H96_26405 [Acidobacteria bacterium RIFCSPLOWO2_02_FULL_67_36]